MYIYYPHELSRRNDEDDIISLITTPNNISITELKTFLLDKSYNVIILLCSLSKNNYKELILRLTETKNIVVLLENIVLLKNIELLVSNYIYMDAMIKFRINVKILKITFIAHGQSCNSLLNTSFNNKIIFIDPIINQKTKINKSNNIYIFTFSDISYDKKTKDIINSISVNVYTIHNIDSSFIFINSLNNLLLLNKIDSNVSKLYEALKIII